MVVDRGLRGLIFWTVCIPLRTMIATHVRGPVARGAAAVIGARWLGGLENGNEGVFGGRAWWAEERPAHGALWLAYAVSADNSFLFLDTAYGALNWLLTPTQGPGSVVG